MLHTQAHIRGALTLHCAAKQLQRYWRIDCTVTALEHFF